MLRAIGFPDMINNNTALENYYKDVIKIELNGTKFKQ